MLTLVTWKQNRRKSKKSAWRRQLGTRTEPGTMSGSDLDGEHLRYRGRRDVRIERKENVVRTHSLT